MVIPRLAERLKCMLFRRRLELDIEEIRPELNALRNASHELRSSSKFKQVLQVCPLSTFTVLCTYPPQAVLSVGNALNGSTFRGGARGVKIDTLLKVCHCLAYS